MNESGISIQNSLSRVQVSLIKLPVWLTKDRWLQFHALVKNDVLLQFTQVSTS